MSVEYIHIIDTEQRNVVIDNTNELITGNVQILNVDEIGTILISEQGPAGATGAQGAPGVPGSGKPFSEIITGQLFRSTSSLSIFGNVGITGSLQTTQDLISYGRIGVNTTPSAFFDVVSDNGSIDLVKITSQSLDTVTVNRHGLFVLGEYSYTPPPVRGSIFFSASNFYFAT